MDAVDLKTKLMHLHSCLGGHAWEDCLTHLGDLVHYCVNSHNTQVDLLAEGTKLDVSKFLEIYASNPNHIKER